MKEKPSPYSGTWYNGVDHYTYTDATSAQYQLTDVGGTGIWSSEQSAYIWYDSAANKLHFKDGTFWLMACVSGGTEIDAGTMYPTVIEDSNGNQVILTYQAGAGAIGNNSSSRITTIQDVRGTSPSYTVTWAANSISIANSIATNETYTINLTPISQVTPAFGADSNNWGTANQLSSIVLSTGALWQFTYDPAGSGELTQITFPDGGHVRWVYGTANYTGSNRKLREISSRYVANTSGAAEWGPYTLSHDDSGNPNPTMHANTTLVDASGIGAKRWNFLIITSNSQNLIAGVQRIITKRQAQAARPFGMMCTRGTCPELGIRTFRPPRRHWTKAGRILRRRKRRNQSTSTAMSSSSRFTITTALQRPYLQLYLSAYRPFQLR